MEISWVLNVWFACALQCAYGNFRLPDYIIPSHYDLKIIYDIDPLTNFSFYGTVDIMITTTKTTSKLVLHAKNFIVAEEKIRLIIIKPLSWAERYNEDIAVTKVMVDDNYDFLTLDLKGHLRKNEFYSLSIPFYGNLKTDYDGIFISSYVDKKTMANEFALVTKFGAIGAREAFPCFDEPMMKATFSVTIGHHRDYHALSNMPLASTHDENAIAEPWPWEVIEGNFRKNKDDFVFDHFDKTPMISTCLVAFVVSKFQRVKCKPGPSNINISIWTRQDISNRASYVAKIAPKISIFYNNWYNVSHAVPKLDHVFIYNFSASAIDNWGLITYAEYNLYDRTQHSLDQKRSATANMAHEVNHQWFGSLVTMKWWSDNWLSEGFANFMSIVYEETSFPEETDYADIAAQVNVILSLDALHTSNPVSRASNEALDPKYSDTKIFDAISYRKAAILIRMLYLVMGEEVFKEAVHKFLVKFSFKNAVPSDLWDQLYEAAIEHDVLRPNVTVEHVMNTWVTQSGYPLLTVQRDYEAKSLTIIQERYLSLGLKSTTPIHQSSPSWWIPLTIVSQYDEQRAPLPVQWLAADEGTTSKQQYSHGINKDEWILFNENITALCRVNYDTRNWKLLINTLVSDRYKSIPALSRAQLLTDAFELAWTDQLDYSVVFHLASYLRQEEENRIVHIALTKLSTIEDMLKRTSDYEIFQKYMRKLMEETFKKFGVLGAEIQNREDYNGAMMKKILTPWACRMNVPGCEDAAIELFQNWMKAKDPDHVNPIPVYQRETVYCVGVARGGLKHWHFVLERTYYSDNTENVKFALRALACTRQSWLLYRTLELILFTKGFGTQNAALVIAAIMQSPEGLYIGKDFVYKRGFDWFTRFQKVQDSSSYIIMAFTITQMVNQLTSQLDLDEFLMWRDKYVVELEPYAREVQQSVEKARIRISWLARNRQLVVEKMRTFSTNFSISPMNQLLGTLRFYATASTQLNIGDFCGWSPPTANKIIHRVSAAIAALHKEYIKFPETLQEIRAEQNNFFSIARFPRVIGAMDCTHIRLASTSFKTNLGEEQAELFRNRKGYFSINVQTICNANLEIMDIVARWPGSSHDSTIFNNCCRRAKFEAGDYGDAVLVVDGGYASTPYMMPPLQNPRTQAEQLYNESQIRTRNPVERSYGVWKRRFPVLGIGLRVNLDKAMTVIIATAVLHNILCRQGELMPSDDPNLILPAPWEDILRQGQMPRNYAVSSTEHRYRDNLISNYFHSLL